jgi:hypothetical protein
VQILAPFEVWLSARRALLWWILAYLLVVVAVAALAHIFGTSTPGLPGLGRGAD